MAGGHGQEFNNLGLNGFLYSYIRPPLGPNWNCFVLGPLG